jgi:hypothetical protein
LPHSYQVHQEHHLLLVEKGLKTDFTRSLAGLIVRRGGAADSRSIDIIRLRLGIR